MTRFHVAVLVLDSLALSGYLAAWMLLLPDGFRCRFPSMDFIYLNWGESLLGALGLYTPVCVRAERYCHLTCQNRVKLRMNTKSAQRAVPLSSTFALS